MKENKNMIERAIGKAAPQGAKQGMPELSGQEGLAPMVNELYALMQSGEAPEGFALEQACRDEEFVSLADEYGVAAAARIWTAEKRAEEAETAAMARVSQQVQQRRGLPRSSSGGGFAAARNDYAGMDSAAFKKLSEDFRRRARNGERVQL